MATMVIFILVLLFGPSVISLPFVAMFFSDKEIKVSKSLVMLYIGIMSILTLVWAFVLTTQIDGTPIHFNI